jgi:hypothetical protein
MRTPFPECGRPVEVAATRELLVRRLPYTVVYTVFEQRVSILDVYDQRRQR